VSESERSDSAGPPPESLSTPAFETLENAASTVLRTAAEIAASRPAAPVSQEWQGAFAAARTAVSASADQAAAIAAFGLENLVHREVLALAAPAAAIVRTLAATAVELRAIGRAGLAVALASLTIEIAGQPDLTAALPFFVCLEALVRARLAHDAGGHGPHAASSYWQIAHREAAMARGAGLVLCGGLSGSGKSFVGTGLAATLGAVILNSDRARKELAGIESNVRTPASRSAQVYSTRMTDRVYRQLARRSTDLLGSGRPVVLDATFLTPARRKPPLRVAQEMGAPAAIVWCDLPQAEAAARLRRRTERQWAVSDADARIRALQRSGAQPPAGDECGARLLRVDASADPATLFERLIPRLRRALSYA